MNSSISNSDFAAANSRWRAWLSTFALTPLLFALVCGLTILLDPFSTGRFSPIARIDFADRDLLYGHAARARDPDFNAAIIGNSHGLLFSPARLTAATGQRFAQFSVLGLNPSEQLMIARAVIRNHRHRPLTLLMVLDEPWCEAQEAHNRIRGYFPIFLFESSPLEYFTSMISLRAVKAAAYRMAMIVGVAGDRQRRDGYDPISFAKKGSAEQLAQLQKSPRPTEGAAVDAPLPAWDGLQALASEFEPETRLIMFFTPVPIFAVPVPGSPAARRLEFCKARFRTYSGTRPHSAFIDHMVDDAFARDMRNFADTMHLDDKSVPVVEQALISAILSTRAD